MFGIAKKNPEDRPSWDARLKSGLSRTREAIGSLLAQDYPGDRFKGGTRILEPMDEFQLGPATPGRRDKRAAHAKR